MSNGSSLVFDAESDGFLKDVTKVHMIVTEDFHTGVLMAYHDHLTLTPRHGSLAEGVKALNEAHLIAGHNIRGYDCPLMKMLLDFNPHDKQKNIDTIVMSRSLFPERWEHSIESWAKTLKMKEQKIQNDEWSVATQLMLDRCISDVKINTNIFRYFLKVVNEHHQQGTNWMGSFFREMEISELHTEQTQHGVMYDVPLAMETLVVFDEELLSLREIIMEGAPPVMEIPAVTGPKRIAFAEDESEGFKGVAKPFKKDGNHSAIVTKWFENTEHDIETIKAPFCKINFRPMNPNSDPEIKKFLYTLGWTPDEWNMKKLEGGGFKRNSPKLSESSFGSLPDGLGQTIKTYRTLKHRRGLIQSIKNPETAGALAKVRPDGRVQAEAITCGTPTARYTHSGAVCNIPRPSSLYGAEVRKLYRVPEGHWMVGVDLSGIEARMLAHGCYPFVGGPEFAALVTTGDWHSANAAMWKCCRNDAKTELYALMFGAGGQKLGNILGVSAAQGLANKKKFMDTYKPYFDLTKKLEAEYEKNNGWIQGIDGRRLYVRAKKDCLNTYTQGNSAILFKEWCLRLRDLRRKSSVRIEQLIAYHDETQNEVYSSDKGLAEIFGWDCEQAAVAVGEYFNLNIKVEAEAKVGMNWAECH